MAKSIHSSIRSLLAELIVRKEVTMKRVESIGVLVEVEAFDAQYVPIIFNVRVAERDL